MAVAPSFSLHTTPSRKLRILLAVAIEVILLLQVWAHATISNSGRSPADGPQAESPKMLIDAASAIHGELSGGRKDAYSLSFPDGKYAKLLVKQEGIDVVVRLLGADGNALVEFDADPRKVGEEVVEFTTAARGARTLIVEPRQKNASAGNYEINVAELRDATDKDLALNEARELNTEAIRLWRDDKYDDALPVAERALAIRERELGPEHPDVATSVLTLANVYVDKADYAHAEPLYLRALQIREKVFGPTHVAVSAVLNNLGLMYQDQGDYARAESCFLRALAIREQTLEPDHILIASVLNNLAIIAHDKGEVTKAEDYYQRALTIREKALGPESPEVATTLNNIANLYSDRQKAEPLYLRALAIREKALGPGHPDVAQTLYNLGVLYSVAGEYAKAEEFTERAQKIFEKALGPEHPFVSYTLNLRAALYKLTGDYARSESLYQRSIAIKEATQGVYHPDLAGALANLANLYVVKGDVDKAIATQRRADEIFEYNIRLNLAAGSEEQKLVYLQTLSNIEDQTIMLHLRKAPNSEAAAELAADTVLQRKGRVLDATANSFASLRSRSSPQDQQVLDQFSETTNRLAGFVFQGPHGMSGAEYGEKIKTLEQQRERLEAQISAISAGSYPETKPATVARIQSALPADSALLEFAVYQPISPMAYEFASDRPLDPEAVGESRYAIYVIRKDRPVSGLDLGPAKEIDQAIASFRQALREPQRQDVTRLARAAYEKIMAPLESIAGDAERLLISPDGDLNLIPFEALADKQGQYLIQRYSISYLTAGRDLLRLQANHKSQSPPVIVADPIYDGAEELAPIEPKATKQTATMTRRSVTSGADLSAVYFAPLSGTAAEAQAIKAVFPDAVLFTGVHATKASVEHAIAPSILHIATHGFFLSDAASGKGAPSADAHREASSNSTKPEIENPLLRSGLAFAGANLRKEKEKGILTALEASTLNLWGTRLVTLSACDTGVGAVKTGEGIYGLRRAFFLAGTESLVMSLWPVSDYGTRQLMTSYYSGLKKGLGRGEALRQTKLAMLKRKDRRHPFYWAGFIQAGEWANLEGQR